MNMKKLKEAFYQQKYNAENRRKIEFLLTFEQWLDIWMKSGHLEERGRRKGEFVMSRKNDIGPYAIGNVDIQLHSSNSSDGNKGKPSSNKGKLSPKKGIPISEDHKKKISEAKKGIPSPNKGIPRSEDTKKKISDAKKGIPRSEDYNRRIDNEPSRIAA